MADLYAADVKLEEAVETLEPLLVKYAQNRQPDESLGDFYQRVLERSDTRHRVTGKEEAMMETLQPKLVQIGV